MKQPEVWIASCPSLIKFRQMEEDKWASTIVVIEFPFCIALTTKSPHRYSGRQPSQNAPLPKPGTNTHRQYR